MARSPRASTMASRPPATAWDGGYVTGPEIAQREELLQQLSHTLFVGPRRRVGQDRVLLDSRLHPTME